MRALPLLFLLASAILLAGCADAPDGNETANGDDDPVDPNTGQNDTAPAERIEVRLTGAYPLTIAYQPAAISVANGTNVTIVFTNSDTNPAAPHDWVLEGYEDVAATERLENGQTGEVTFLAPPTGDYVFYCSVPQHRQNGMEGTFTVT